MIPPSHFFKTFGLVWLPWCGTKKALLDWGVFPWCDPPMKHTSQVSYGGKHLLLGGWTLGVGTGKPVT